MAGHSSNLYLNSKRKIESLLFEFAREKSFFIASALPTWMWGPHDVGPTPSGKLVYDALANKLPPVVLPGGSAVVDARDVAIGMLHIAQIGRSGERYILSGGFAELADIVANLATLTGRKPPKRRISFIAAIARATAAETWSRITGNDSLMSVEAIRLMNARLCVTAAKAQKELGVTFREFPVTLADTVAWARTTLQVEAEREAADSISIQPKTCLSWARIVVDVRIYS